MTDRDVRGAWVRYVAIATAVAIAIAVVALVAVTRAVVDRSAPTADPSAAPTRPSGTVTRTTEAPTAPTASAAPTATTAPSVTASTTPTAPATSPRPTVPPALAGRDVEYLPGSARVVVLTFDAGANADGVPSVLDTLRREGVAATFFLTGDFAARFPDPAAAMATAGHRLGNHSVDHPHFPGLSDGAIRTQLADAELTVLRVTGRSPRPLFRFPFGDRDPRSIATVNAAGYVAVRWTVDSLGWQGTSGGRTVDSVVARVLGAARPGAIVLMHVGSHPGDRSTLDADALPAVIAGLRSAGYRFVTLDALLEGA